MQVTGSKACMKDAFERLCTVKMESISFLHLGGAVMEITGNFSFFIDNIKQVDKIVNLQKYAEDGEVVFSV